MFRDAIEPEFQHLEEFLGPSGVFVDVGASSGIYTLKAAKHYSKSDGVVLAIEPFIDVLADLLHSIESNDFTNIRLRNCCASDRTGSAKLWRNFRKPNQFSLVRRDEEASFLQVMTVAIDDLLVWESLERLDYLKIDAEGAEARILRGARRTIERLRPIIQMETTYMDDATIDLGDYSGFHAPSSVNTVYMPNEHPKILLPARLGWAQVS